VEGDLVVAADGIKSAVRKQFLPDTLSPYTFGVYGIVGKVFLDNDAVLKDLEYLKRGVCMVSGTNGRSMFIAPQIYSDTAKFEIGKLFLGVDGVTHESQLAPNASGDDLLLLGGGDKKELVDDARDYIFYGFLTSHSEDLPISSTRGFSIGTSQQDLLDATVSELRRSRWAPEMIDLIEKTDVNAVGYWPLHVSPAVADISQYKPYNLTFLGDSIHASMSFVYPAKSSASDRWRGREYCPSRCRSTLAPSYQGCIVAGCKDRITN